MTRTTLDSSAPMSRFPDRLTVLIEAMAVPVRLLDLDGACVWSNPAWSEVTGRPRTEGEGEGWLEAVHPGDRDRVRSAVRYAILQRGSAETAYRLRGADGAWRWVRDRIAPSGAVAGGGDEADFEGFVVTTGDIDDERRELESTRAQLASVSHLTERMGDVGLVARATVTSQGILRTVSGRFAELQGRGPEQLMGRRMSELGRPLGRALAAAVDDVLTSGLAVSGREAHDPLQDRWWACTVEPLNENGNDFEALLVVAREITDQKRVERDLDLSEQRLRLAAEAAPLTLFHCDRRLRFTWISRPLRERDPDELLGLTPRDLFGPQAEELERLQRRVLRTGRSAHAELAFRARGYVRTWECWAEPQRDDEERVMGVMVVALESTERKEALAALRGSEERFRGTFENAGVGVAHVALDGRVLRINRRFCGILGYTPDELLGRQLHDLVHQDDWAAVERLSPPVDETRIRFFRSDRQIAWLLLTVSSGRGTDDTADSGDTETYAIVVAQNITAQVLAEQALNQLTATLEQQVAKRTARLERQAEVLRRLASELTTTEQRERKRLAEMLHDHLQQYLVAARLKVGLAKRKAGGELLAVLQESGGGLLTLLQEADAMLDEARKSARTLTAELRPPVLYEHGLVPALKWHLGRVREQYGLEVQLDAEPEAEPAAEHVRALLYATIKELLLNVVKHADASEAAVLVELSGQELHVRVSDRGRGFDSRTLEWERDPTGFGLVSVRERITALEGRIELRSVPGEGTAIDLYVPMGERVSAAVADELVEAAPVRRLSRPGEVTRVLLADDHEMVREGLRNLLEEDPGIEVVELAADGQEAIELAGALQPEVVVMDVNMPRVNGIEATRVITQRWPHVGVVGLSVQDEGGTAESMREAGAYAYLSKGGNPGLLIETILECAQRLRR